MCASGAVSEYGDSFDVMGNISTMHFNAMQKSLLQWIPATSVKTHTSGTATYTLSPIESGGAASYAIKVPAAANRTYWVEYRQPIGFDGPGLALCLPQQRRADPVVEPVHVDFRHRTTRNCST